MGFSFHSTLRFTRLARRDLILSYLSGPRVYYNDDAALPARHHNCSSTKARRSMNTHDKRKRGRSPTQPPLSTPLSPSMLILTITTTAATPTTATLLLFYYHLVHSCIHPTPVGSECLGSSGNDASDPPHIVMLICNIMIGARR